MTVCADYSTDPQEIAGGSRGDIACGAVSCGIGESSDLVQSGHRYMTCTRCATLRLPPAQYVTGTVETDAPKSIDPALRLLFALRMRWLRRNLPVIKDRKMRILDVGCGDGQFLRYLAQGGYELLIGVEHDYARRANAQSRGITVLPSISELGNARYDLIVMWHVLEHVRRPMEMLSGLAEHLATGGVLLVSIPNHAGWTTRFFGKYSCYLDYGRHIWYWNNDIIRQIRGIQPYFEVVELRGCNFEYETFAWLDSMASRIFRTENVIHRRIKKGMGTRIEKLVAMATTLMLLPIAVLMAAITPAGSGSTVTFRINKRSAA